MESVVTFDWGKEFETNISVVDQQHHHLVDLANGLSDKLSDEGISINELTFLFKELFEYAQAHFSDEENLMVESGMYQKSIDEHIANHRMFLNEVTTLYSELSSGENSYDKAKSLLNFLIHWLGFHILGQDKRMAEQMELINEGLSAKEAYERVKSHESEQTAPLIKSLNGLLDVLSRRNKELLDFKRSLELKVQDRTRELIEANKHLEQLSLTDQLTSLPNRRYAMKTLNTLWVEYLKYQIPLSILMIDADNFKIINDTHGHDAGDAVLVGFARTLRESVRTDDIVCRLGGDEFLVICPNTYIEGGIHVANNLLRNINNLKIPVGQKNDKWKGSASIGVACVDKNTKTYEDLIKVADINVYRSKEAGRNCIRA